ncbi:MAG: hypothetical protein ACD_45C00602G0008 [uncultured bacterium]|nr:MAG: hypothetical protein ACD_45C00602G0008 [uncultured bacterium]
MKFQLAHGNLEKYTTDCLVVGIYEDHTLTGTAQKLDKISQGYLTQLIKKDEAPGKVGQTLLLYHVPHISAERVLLVGCGKNSSLSTQDYRRIIANSIKALSALRITDITLCLTEVPVTEHNTAWKIKQTVEVILDNLYQFNEFKSEKKPKPSLQHIHLRIEKIDPKLFDKAIKQGLAVASGVAFTKNLANLPSNICTPSYLASEAKSLAKKYSSITTHVLEENQMKKLGMGAFLAVAKGSAQNPKLICIEYKGTTKKQDPIALIGKGITFDTGGISLKPADAMIGMKYDMCGAATVLGTLKAAAELKLPLHIVGILATAENMPSGTATKPEDIVTSLSGQTIEIMNTDAEGRLVLCDALTYAEQKYHPKTVIDIATLTGAVVIALGHHASGLLANHQPLADELLQAGIESHDRAWQMPLWEEYQEQLKSPFADMSNVGGRAAGTITAACFLSRFTKKLHWAHLDVAGTAAMMGGNDRYATGRPVPLLTQFLLNRCKQ